MKIYFAGSIRGGREDVPLYSDIIDLLKQHGEVLTEHVGQIDPGEDSLSDGAIYHRDMTWLKESDAVVAEVTVPSHGVGYEIARAETMNKPILCLHRPGEGRHLSALIAGNPDIQCVLYRRLAELKPLVDRFLRDTTPTGDPT